MIKKQELTVVIYAAAMSILACWGALGRLSETGGSKAGVAATFIFLVYATLASVILRMVPSRENAQGGIIALTLMTVALFVMTRIFVDYAAASTIQASVSIFEVLPPSHFSTELRALLEPIQVKAGCAFVMDGQVDVWVFILSQVGLNQIPYQEIPVAEQGILYFYSSMMWVLQEHVPYFMLLVNWAAHVFSAVLIYGLCQKKLGRNLAVWAAGIFMVFPENIYWSAKIYKDGLVTLVILLTLYAVRRVRSENKKYYFLLSAALFALSFLRSGLLLPVICICFVLNLLGDFHGAGRRALEYVSVVLIASAVFWAIVPRPAASDVYERAVGRIYAKLKGGSSSHLDKQNITYRTSKESSLIEKFGGGDLTLGKIYYVPIRILSYLIAPFPPYSRGNQADWYVLSSTLLLSLLLVPFGVGFTQSFASGQDDSLQDFSISFIILGVAIAFAGPFVYERYRIAITPFFIIVALKPLITSFGGGRAKMMMCSAILWLAILALWFLLKS